MKVKKYYNKLILNLFIFFFRFWDRVHNLVNIYFKNLFKMKNIKVIGIPTNFLSNLTNSPILKLIPPRHVVPIGGNMLYKNF